MAAISLTQPGGCIMIFTKQGGQRTVVALDMGAGGQAQRTCLVMPPGLAYDMTWALCKWYTENGHPDPQETIKKLCRMRIPTRGATGCYGNARSPYNTVADLDQVPMQLCATPNTIISMSVRHGIAKELGSQCPIFSLQFNLCIWFNCLCQGLLNVIS